jgi:hypothetical protein
MAKAPKACNACFENGRPLTEHNRQDCAAYESQRTWNRKVARLLADTTPWHERPVPPAPDYSEPWIPGTGRDSGVVEIYRLLSMNGIAYRRFKAAVQKAEAA